MADFDLEKKVEFALNDLVRKRHTFSLAEVNGYLGPQHRMDFEEIFEIARPILQKMSVSWHGEVAPMRIVVSVEEPFVSKIHVVQSLFPDFMEAREWGIIVELFKEKGDSKWVKILGGLLAEYIKINPELKNVDFISPVPCEKETIEALGYDPNVLIANEIIKEISIPVVKVFSKTRKTDFCKMRSLDEKEESIKGAFSLVNPGFVKEKHVLLLDDIMNSGTTIKHLAGMLEEAEAKKADVLVLNQNR
ncbi:MAG: phosphoribosyltransferase family protein [Candidatus Diapherotrites archaeon]|nr:phosphoribosyltransferase family protein [Candidatus Diapherotrites archaeon]